MPTSPYHKKLENTIQHLIKKVEIMAAELQPVKKELKKKEILKKPEETK
jgi:hypothetical protein